MSGRLILGIDAGGTKTLARLARLRPDGTCQPLAQATAGPANWNSNPQQARRHLEQALEQLLRQAELPPGQIDSACLAVAGAGRPEQQEELHRWAHEHAVAQRVLVVHDAAAVLAAGGTGQLQGVAVIAGTGSLVWGRDAAGREARALGWGPLLGDPGSGYALATEALRHAARELDQQGRPDSLLTREVLHHLGIGTLGELIRTLSQGENSPRRVARLAPVVLEAARNGCPAACRIGSSQAAELAQAVLCVLRQLDPGPEPLLALGGGVLVHCAWYRRQFLRALEPKLPAAARVKLVPEPVEGALHLAAGALRESSTS